MSDTDTDKKEAARQAAFIKAFNFSQVGISEQQEEEMKRAARAAYDRLTQLIEDANLDFDDDGGDYPDSSGVFDEAETFLRTCYPESGNYPLSAALVLGCRARIKTLEALRASKDCTIEAQDEDLRATRLEEIGDRIRTTEDAGFVIAALKAKFNVEAVAGHLGKKALPRLYKLLNDLPPGHTTFNNSLKTIVRGADGQFSFFSTTDKLVQVNVGSMKETKQYEMEGHEVEVNKFDSTMLHEVGHSIDDAIGLMATRKGNADYGGWRELSLQDVIAEGVVAFRSSWKGPMPSGDAIAELLEAAVSHGQVLSGIMVGESELPVGELESDATIEWARAAYGIAGHARNLSKAQARTLALGDRVYIKDGYRDGAWFSYLLSARDAQVSNYQFYAPPEWFAEVYAMHMLGKLPQSHPCHGIIDALDGRNKITS